jgi:hypothetical protein
MLKIESSAHYQANMVCYKSWLKEYQIRAWNLVALSNCVADDLRPAVHTVTHQDIFLSDKNINIVLKRFTSAKFFFLETDSQSTGKRNGLSLELI